MITDEQIQEFIQDESNKEKFTEWAKAAGFESQDDVQGLKNNNEKLLKELKKQKEKNIETQKILDEIDIDEYNRYKQGNQTDDDKLQRELKRISQEKESIENNFREVENQLNKTLIENSLIGALEANGYNQHKSILQQAFSGKAKIEINDGSRNVVIDDNGMDIPINDYFKKFSESDQGKKYLDEKENIGTGSRFSTGGGNSKVITMEQLNNMPPKDRSKFFEDGGKLQE